MQFLLDVVAMPPNTANSPSPAKQDPIDAIIRRYLTVDDVLHEEALEVVQRWYMYMNTLGLKVLLSTFGCYLTLRLPHCLESIH